MNVNYKISQTIKMLGISPAVKGYYAIREALKLVIKDKTYIFAITNRLYPQVAKILNSTATRTERVIRHAIETGWRRGNVELQCEMFDYGVLEAPNPTNSEFIATVADYISIKMEEENEDTKDN